MLMKTSRSGRLLPIALALALSPTTGHTAEDTRFVSASSQNLRAQPQTGSEIRAVLRLNQAVTLLQQTNTEWCEVRTATAQQGFVSCASLAGEKTTARQIEIEMADLILSLRRANDGYSIDYRKSEATVDRLFQQLERHFALSPSLHTYADYAGLRGQLLEAMAQDSQASPRLIDKLKARESQLVVMRRALNADFAKESFPVVRQSATALLGQILYKRTLALRASQDFTPAQDRVKPSWLGSERWISGWAGGPLVQRVSAKPGAEAIYRVRYNGFGPRAASDVIEMAKAQGSSTSVSFQNIAGKDLELSLMSPGNRESVRVRTTLPAWAVTADGLVAGQFREIRFNGDACAGEMHAGTYAEFSFPKPIAGEIHAMLISNVPIDPQRARVTVKRRTFLATPTWDENTLTHAVRAQVDLDGDGIPDLRTVISEDRSVSGLDAPTRQLAAWRHSLGIRPHKAGGWYANDLHSLQANEGGVWRIMSLYNVVTCT